MYSNEDLERFYFQYKTEALPHGVSIQDFCVRNKAPYNILSKRKRDSRIAQEIQEEICLYAEKVVTLHQSSLNFGMLSSDGAPMRR